MNKTQLLHHKNVFINAPQEKSVQKERALLDFEFMDLESLPTSLRLTLRDLLHVSCNFPFRSYDEWAAQVVYDYAQKHHVTEITELGAGSAPITRILIKKYPHWNVRFNVTDILPDEITFKELSELDPRVNCVWRSVDFTKPQEDLKDSLLVLSATFHHIAEKERPNVLKNLKAISPHVLILELTRHTLSSILLMFGAVFPGLLGPLFYLTSKKFFRCAFWCWLVPVAPLMLVWDGIISCFRCWTDEKWERDFSANIEEALFCSKIEYTWD